MRVRFRQSLEIGGTRYGRGEVAELPPRLALICYERGTAEPCPQKTESARPAGRREKRKRRQ